MTTQTYHITGMDCAGCARTIETGVGKLAGIEACNVNFMAAKLTLQGDVAAQSVIARVQELGYGVIEEEDRSSSPVLPPIPQSSSAIQGFVRYLLQRRETTLALIGALLIVPGLLVGELLPLVGIGAANEPSTTGWVALLSIGAMMVAGLPVARSAWRSLLVNREISINLLMTLAGIGAVVIGAYTEAGLVMVLFAIGEALEGYTMERARQSIRAMLQVAPNEATRIQRVVNSELRGNNPGIRNSQSAIRNEQRISVNQLQLGDLILVKPGERIAMDGTIMRGASGVNQAPITGESLPVEKTVGDAVFAGTINGAGVLEVEVTALVGNNLISRMIRMVEEAQERRAPVQRFIDHFARVYTPAVVVIAALVAILPPLLFAQPFWNPDAQTQGWLYRALELLVVACPCALVISTPVSIVAAISNAARNGVLIKGGAFLEALSRVRAIAFDKTGTLTEGKPSVVTVQSIHCQSTLHSLATCEPCSDLLALASAVESRSEHPLAAAVVSAATQYQVHRRYPVAESVSAQVGLGVTGNVQGEQIFIGNHRYFDTHVPHATTVCTEINDSSASGHTPILVSRDGAYQGYISVADTVRSSSRATLAQLKQVGIEALVMLTGDSDATAQRIAADVGVTDVRSDLLPEHKVDAVKALLAKYGSVAMVGDGINDAPALATASVGIAMGAGGSAQAIETADVALMNDSLERLPFVLRLSRATMTTIRQNVAFALGIKALFLIAVLFGVGTMWMAVLADVGASLLVTLNGMRMLRYDP